MKTAVVVGLGKIGLPLAAQFASKGMRVIGCDVLVEVVESVNAGKAHIREEAGLDEAVASAVRAKRLSATTDTTAAVQQADTVVVIVPLMVSPDRTMDYRSLDAATRAVGRGLKPGTLVVYETTLPVGTTRRRIAPMLEKESGIKAGAEFHLAFSPERLYAGRIFEDLRRYPKIVGGVDDASSKAAVAFYESVLDAEVWAVENRSLPKPLIATSTSPSPTSSPCTPRAGRSTSPRLSRPRTPSLTRTSTGRASASAATASRCTRTSSSAMPPTAS